MRNVEQKVEERAKDVVLVFNTGQIEIFREKSGDEGRNWCFEGHSRIAEKGFVKRSGKRWFFS